MKLVVIYHIIHPDLIYCHLLKLFTVTDPLDKLPRLLKKNLNKNLCVCNDVPKIDIINAIVNGATSIAEIRKETYATMGSGCCKQDVERLIECLSFMETDK